MAVKAAFLLAAIADSTEDGDPGLALGRLKFLIEEGYDIPWPEWDWLAWISNLKPPLPEVLNVLHSPGSPMLENNPEWQKIVAIPPSEPWPEEAEDLQDAEEAGESI